MTFSVGQEMPDFQLSSTKHEDKVKLSDYRDRKNILLAFFPLAFTPG